MLPDFIKGDLKYPRIIIIGSGRVTTWGSMSFLTGI